MDDRTPQGEARRRAIAEGELDFPAPEAPPRPLDEADEFAELARPSDLRVALDHDLAALAPRPGASAGKRWRFRRDLVIWHAHRRGGFSQRLLADVFDLPRSRVAAIVARFDGALACTPSTSTT